MYEENAYTVPTKKRLKGFLGKKVFRNAEALLHSERSLGIEVVFHPHASVVYTEISGRVEDMDGDEIEVDAVVASEGTVVETSCSCGASQPCEHVGAALLVCSDEQYRKNIATKTPKNPKNPKTAKKSSRPGAAGKSPEREPAYDVIDDYNFCRDFEVHLDFEPMDFEEKRLYFRPVFRFSSPKPASKPYRDVIVDRVPDDGIYDFRSDAARSVWADAELSEEEAELLSKTRFEIEEINSLRDVVLRRSRSLHPAVRFDFPYRSSELSEEKPAPRIDINEYREGISLKLDFVIDGSPTGFALEEGFYPRPRTEAEKNTLSLVWVTESYRRYCWESLRERLGSAVVREEPSGSRYHFTAKLSAPDFILDNAAELVEEGWEIRKRGIRLRSYGEKDFSVRTRLSKKDWLEVEVGETDGEHFEPLEIDPAEAESGIISRGDEFIYVDRKVIEKLRRLRLFGTETRGKQGKFTLSPYNAFFWKEFSSSMHHRDSASGLPEESDATRAEQESRLERIRKALARLEDFTGLGRSTERESGTQIGGETGAETRDEEHESGKEPTRLIGLEGPEEPEGFRGSLRDYQKSGLAWLIFLRDHYLAACLADDMGLGKTVQTLALLQRSSNEGLNAGALIVAPVSTLPNWQSEAARFTPELSVYRYHGQQRDPEMLDRHDIVLTSYATLRNDIELFLGRDFSFLILDEAQAIKNAASKTFKAVKMLSAPHRLTLTGTPLENNLLELWAQIDFLLPGLLGSRNAFTERFVKDEENTELLRSTIYPFILRRTKRAVAPELPEKEEITVYAEMEEAQAAFYHRLRKQYREKVKSEVSRVGMGKSSTTIFEALLRLRQAALFPSLLGDEHRHIPSCKFDILTDSLDEITGEGYKTVIFSQFLGSLDRIRSWAEEEGLEYAYLDGSTDKRDEQIAAFQENPEVSLFLISLKAGGLGINLTAADYVVLFDPWWNPAVEQQAIDRVHRIGRTSKVIAYRYIVKNSIEEKILELQESKRELADKIITEEGSLIKSLSREDLEFLFS